MSSLQGPGQRNPLGLVPPALRQAQEAVQAFLPRLGGPAAGPSRPGDSASLQAFSPAKLEATWGAYALAALNPFSALALAGVQSAAQAFLEANGQASPPAGGAAEGGAEAAGWTEDLAAWRAGAKEARGQAQTAVKALKATAELAGAPAEGRVASAVDATGRAVDRAASAVGRAEALGGAGAKAYEGASLGLEGAQELADGQFSGLGKLLQGVDEGVGGVGQGLEAVAQARGPKAPPNTRFARGLEAFLRATKATSDVTSVVGRANQTLGKGEALVAGFTALGDGSLAQGLVDTGQAGVEAVKGVGDTAKALQGGAGRLGLGERRTFQLVGKLAQGLDGEVAKVRLGGAGGALGALGGGVQMVRGAQALLKGEWALGSADLLGGGAATAQGVGLAAKALAPAGRLAAGLGGRAIPALGVVTGGAQSLRALSCDPPDYKTAATGAMSAVGSALLPFAPVGTAVGGALVVGSMIVDNWEAISSAADFVGDQAGQALGAANDAISLGFSSAASSISGWFS